MNIAHIITETIFDFTKDDIYEIDFDTKLHDLELDSLDWVEIVLELENEFNINNFEELMEEWLMENKEKKVVDLINFCQEIYDNSF